MRLEKRPGCRLLSPLPERPIQASNNHCSNTAAYLYTFYQKFKPHSKNTEPIPPYSPTLSIPRPRPPFRRAHVIPSAARNPKPQPPPPPPRIPRRRPHPNPPRRLGPTRPQDTPPSPPHHSAKPPVIPAPNSVIPARPPVIPANAGIQTSDCIQPPYRHTPPNPPRRRGHTPPPTEPPKGPPAWRLRPVKLLPADAQVRRIPWTVPVARSRLACRGTVV